MIHSIAIENFYSVADRQEMDFRVPRNAPDLACFRDFKATPGHRLPLVIGFYGPNASGKSTMLRAITAAEGFVQHSFSIPPNHPIHGFKPYAHNDWCNRPTKLVIEFDGRMTQNMPAVVFRYELHIGHQPNNFGSGVIYESMSYAPKRRFCRIFERNEQEFNFADESGITNGDSRIQSIRSNVSVISTLAFLNHKPSTDFLASLHLLKSNIFGQEKETPGMLRTLLDYDQHTELLQRLNRKLSRLDLGLEEMKVENTNTGPVAKFKHFGLNRELELEEESMGTRRFIEFFPILQYVLDFGGVAVIDELDTDIHPSLFREIFGWFYDNRRNPNGAQLLFTAHNPSLLVELEKEQVYFTEKPDGQPTRIYGARQIQGLRREPSLMNKYLSGELGALPHNG